MADIVVKPVISLFSGAGGLDLAFESTGYFSSTIYVESEHLFSQTIKLNQRIGNLGSGRVLEENIIDLDPATTWAKQGGCSEPWAIIGGPPCQAFSPIGKQKGRKDPRGALVFQFARWVQQLPVKIFVMENVPGLISIEGGTVFQDLLECFRSSGFTNSYGVVCAADYGAPTIRRRLFIVGTRGLPKFEFPPSTHSATARESLFLNTEPWVTSEEALAGLPAPASETPGTPQGHVLIVHTKPVRARFEVLAPGAVDPVRKRNRLNPKLPSLGLYGDRFHIHPYEPRELTNREAARIQGFPDTYVFNGSRVPVGKQIANAVPIPLGRAFAQAIVQQYLLAERNNNNAKGLAL
jgi:DNA (cytosine-5)-methyltransferase 1